MPAHPGPGSEAHGITAHSYQNPLSGPLLSCPTPRSEGRAGGPVVGPPSQPLGAGQVRLLYRPSPGPRQVAAEEMGDRSSFPGPWQLVAATTMVPASSRAPPIELLPGSRKHLDSFTNMQILEDQHSDLQILSMHKYKA